MHPTCPAMGMLVSLLPANSSARSLAAPRFALKRLNSCIPHTLSKQEVHIWRAITSMHCQYRRAVLLDVHIKAGKQRAHA